MSWKQRVFWVILYTILFTIMGWWHIPGIPVFL